MSLFLEARHTPSTMLNSVSSSLLCYVVVPATSWPPGNFFAFYLIRTPWRIHNGPSCQSRYSRQSHEGQWCPLPLQSVVSTLQQSPISRQAVAPLPGAVTNPTMGSGVSPESGVGHIDPSRGRGVNPATVINPAKSSGVPSIVSGINPATVANLMTGSGTPSPTVSAVTNPTMVSLLSLGPVASVLP